MCVVFKLLVLLGGVNDCPVTLVSNSEILIVKLFYRTGGFKEKILTGLIFFPLKLDSSLT